MNVVQEILERDYRATTEHAIYPIIRSGSSDQESLGELDA